MPNQTSLEVAIGDHTQVPADWMPAAQVRVFIFGDPGAVWLEYHGARYGFQADNSPYEFSDFIATKVRRWSPREMLLAGKPSRKLSDTAHGPITCPQGAVFLHQNASGAFGKVNNTQEGAYLQTNRSANPPQGARRPGRLRAAFSADARQGAPVRRVGQ